jgi:hypothetical protein
MIRLRVLSRAVGVVGTVLSSVASAQNPPPPGAQTPAAPLPPATKLEAFKPAAGTVVTVAYNELGGILGVSVDAREIRDNRGNVVRGVVVEVTQSQYREERAFVDADEIPELLRGIDALLEVKSNPTTYQKFEVRYSTKGELQLTAFGTTGGRTRYAIQAGRFTRAQAFTDEDGLRKLRAMFETAGQQLGAPARNN